MSEKTARGSCFCSEVEYEISGNLGIFQYCHCSRCRKFTGSGYAANILVRPEHFRWLRGSTNVRTYSPTETKYLTTAFCSKCGSSLPWAAKGGKSMVIPAGTLDEHPGIEPQQNLFYDSRASWHCDSAKLPTHAEMPPRKKS